MTSLKSLSQRLFLQTLFKDCSTRHVRIIQKCDSSTKLQPQDYERFLNVISRRRQPSLIRKMTDLQAKSSKNTILFAGGFPNPSLFAFKEAEFTLSSGEKLRLTPDLMQACQQYSPTTGHPALRERMLEFIYSYHKPPCWSTSHLCITCGSQDGFSRSLEMMLWPGDYIIVEEPSFCGALSVINPYQPKYLGIRSDEQGMIPEELEKALSKWDPQVIRNQIGNVPKVIYLNPSGANPSGISISEDRRRKIYKIAQDYNLLILEDDPYYFLQYETLEKCPPSFLSMDVDGRVMRFDSFSKLMAAGFRVGVATGPEPLIRKIVQHSEVTLLHTSALSQVLVNELLKLWGSDRFRERTRMVSQFYQEQRNNMINAAEEHLTGLCDWNIPTGGMFLWAKVYGVEDTKKMALERGLAKEILLMPGSTFMTDESQPCPYVRLSFSFATPEIMQEGCRRLAEVIRDEQDHIRSKKQITAQRNNKMI